MGLNAAVQALKKADKLKERVVNCPDLVNDKEAWICQKQLQEIYQQVLILDLEYALDKKVEQELWMHCFKKFIATLQSYAKDKKNPKRNESQAMLSVCLDAASGFYLSLLQEVCTTFDLDLPFRQKDVCLGTRHTPAPATHPHRASCYYICQHCLVHLGDIARYRNHSRQADAFYRHAVRLSPTSGQPYNQLALLEASRGDRLSTVFHYMRSVAVRHTFPAAASNLALTFEKCISHTWNKESQSTKLTTNEYLSLFLRLHGLLHSCSELETCEGYVKILTDTLTPHIATQSFNSWKLVQMFVINVFAYYLPCREGEETAELTQDEVRMRSLVIHLIAGSLNAFLLPVYTLKQDDSLLDYFALPVVKLTLEWMKLHPQVLTEEGFVRRLQIWPSFCRLLNILQASITDFNIELYSKVPLPEDSDLQGFVPLEKAFQELNFSDQEGSEVHCKLRAARLVNLGDWLSQHSPNLISYKSDNKTAVFEANCGSQMMPSSEMIRELEELSVNKISSPSPSPSETASSRGSNITPELHNPAIDILSTLDTVHEKRAGILKPQVLPIDEVRNGNKVRTRQNVALQTILRRSQELEPKQVTFKTPSPPPPIQAPSVPPPKPPSDWFNNNMSVPHHPPPSFPFPPPPLHSNWPQTNEPPPPPPPLARTPSWWSNQDPSNNKPFQQPTRSGSFAAPPSAMQPLSHGDRFTNLSFQSPFSTPGLFSQPPPPFNPPQQLSDNIKSQVIEPPNNNLMQSQYSLFSSGWTPPIQQPPTQQMASLMVQQSLWFGPGPSPLERLLEQQKQLREGPTPHTDAT